MGEEDSYQDGHRQTKRAIGREEDTSKEIKTRKERSVY